MKKLKTIRAEQKVRQISGSLASTIPKSMTELLGIEKGSTVVWELNPETGRMEVYPKE